MKIRAILLIMLGFGAVAMPGLLAAQECRSVQAVRSSDLPPELAQRVRGCIAAGDYGLAMANFYAFSAHVLFDQQRVKDESAHVVVGELQSLIFGGWSADQMEGLRDVANGFRDGTSSDLAEICAHLQDNGPPDYLPGYMIIRGIVPRKGPDDWQREGFDHDAAWEKALYEFNNCPRVD